MSRQRRNRRTLVLGTGPLVRELLEAIGQRPDSGYRVEGLVVEPSFTGEQFHGYPVVGSVEALDRILRDEGPESIIVTHAPGSVALFEQRLLEVSVEREVRIEQAAAVYERLTGKLPLEALAMEDVVYSDTFRPSPLSLLANRLLSLVAALLGLLFLTPLMLLIALSIRLDDSGTVLFRQERAGYRNRPFTLLKFRTMKEAPEHESEWEEDNAHRITRVGRWLRKFRLDELPQFINVLRGDMNLVGPRPHPACNIEMLALVARNTPDSGLPIPYYALRSSVRPGITGWAQVRYQYANNLQEEIEKLRFDLYYIKHYAFLLDVRILLETVWVVMAGQARKAATARQTKSGPASGVTADGQTTTS